MPPLHHYPLANLEEVVHRELQGHLQEFDNAVARLNAASSRVPQVPLHSSRLGSMESGAEDSADTANVTGLTSISAQ